MLSYTLRERPGDRAAAGDLALVPTLVKLLDSSDSDIQEAALAVAMLFAEAPQQVRYLFQVRPFSVATPPVPPSPRFDVSSSASTPAL